MGKFLFYPYYLTLFWFYLLFVYIRYPIALVVDKRQFDKAANRA